jgi:hypothetical protein
LAAFVVAIPVVRGLIGFVGRHGLVPFAWYRFVLGLGWLIWLLGVSDFPGAAGYPVELLLDRLLGSGAE